jgi:hypothetical protein
MLKIIYFFMVNLDSIYVEKTPLKYNNYFYKKYSKNPIIFMPIFFILLICSVLLIKKNINEDIVNSNYKSKLKKSYEDEMNKYLKNYELEKKFYENTCKYSEYFKKINEKIKIETSQIENSKITKYFSDYIINEIKKNLNKKELEEFLYNYNLNIININENISFQLNNINNNNKVLDGKIMKILKEFTQHVSNNIYIVNKSIIKIGPLKELVLFQNGVRNNVPANCLLATLENGLIHNLFKIKKNNSKDLLKIYYLALLNYNRFLTEIENIQNKLSYDERLLMEETLNTYSSNTYMKNYKKLNNILLKKIKIIPILKIDEDLNNEKFYELIKDNIDKINNILRNVFNRTNPLLCDLIVLYIFNIYNLYISYNDSSNLKPYKMPIFQLINQDIYKLEKTIFNNELMNIIPIQYMLLDTGHVYYSIYTTNENDYNEVKKFMEDWYNWINKNYIDFIKIKFLENIY